MKCDCGAMSTILVEDEHGVVTPKCESCYYSPKFTQDEISTALQNIERKAKEMDKLISHLGTLAASELKSRLERDEQRVVDVREPSEWKEGYIEGANAYSSGT